MRNPILKIAGDDEGQIWQQCNTCPVSLNEGLGFNSIIDVLKMKMLQYNKDGGTATVTDIPESQAKLRNFTVRLLKKLLNLMNR